jgi:hypothetical protein
MENMINAQNHIKSLIITQELNINSVVTGTKKWMLLIANTILRNT